MPKTAQSSTAPKAGEVDVDKAERVLMDHRGWCGVPDGTACLGCRQTAIEAVAALRNQHLIEIPNGITSFVDLPKVADIWHFDFSPNDALVVLVKTALISPQCMGTAEEAALTIVAGFERYGLLSANRRWGNKLIKRRRKKA